VPPARSALENLVTHARSLFEVSVDVERLEAWVSGLSQPATERLDPGVVLACALFDRQPAALACFERTVAPRVRAALKKLGADDVAVEEHLQAARTRLLADDGGARLRQYRGVGSFEAFVVTMAVRALTDAHRGPRSHGDDEPLARLPASVDLERELARTGQAQHFAMAFREALEALSPRERALLKLNLVDGASIDALAPLYRVSRATAARWLASARQALQKGTLERLGQRTRLEGPELDGLLASLESGFDVSLRRFVEEATVQGDG
jgi:RNA polymerase sigma-70 factor (ECF subfamily)